MEISCPQCGTTYRIPAESISAEGRDVRCKLCQHVWHKLPSDHKPVEESQFQPEPAPFEVDFSGLSQQEVLPPPLPEPPPRPLAPPTIEIRPEPVLQPTDHISAREIPPTPEIVSPPAQPKPRAPASKLKPKISNIDKTITTLKVSFGTVAACGLIAALLAYYPEMVEKIPSTKSLYAMLGMYDASSLSLTDVKLGKTDSDFSIDCNIKNSGGNAMDVPPVRISLRDGRRELLASTSLQFEGGPIPPGGIFPCKTITLDMKHFDTPPTTATLDIGNSFDLSLRK